MQNLYDCFDCNITVKNKTILLFDDIFTTGTTMQEAAKCLKQAGAKKLIGIAFCGR